MLSCLYLTAPSAVFDTQHMLLFDLLEPSSTFFSDLTAIYLVWFLFSHLKCQSFGDSILDLFFFHIAVFILPMKPHLLCQEPYIYSSFHVSIAHISLLNSMSYFQLLLRHSLVISAPQIQHFLMEMSLLTQQPILRVSFDSHAPQINFEPIR